MRLLLFRFATPVAVFAAACSLLLSGLTAMGGLAAPTGVQAAANDLRVDPAEQSVPANGAITLRVLQSQTVPTMGVQFDLKFDPALLEPVSVEPGPAYQGGMSVLGGDGALGPAAYEAAKTTGTLKNITAFFLPGSGGPVTAGEKHAITINMKAKGASGASKIELSNAFFLDEQGGEVPSGGATPGNVTVTGGGAPVAPSAPAAGGVATPPSAGGPPPVAGGPPGTVATPILPPLGSLPPTGGAAIQPGLATATGVQVAPPPLPPSGVSASAAAPLKPGLRTVPEVWRVAAGETFTIHVVQTAPVSVRNTQFQLEFKPDVIRLLDIERGPSFAAAGQTLDKVVSEANETGVIKNLLLTASSPAPAGEEISAVLSFRALESGTSPVSLSKGVILDTAGSAHDVANLSGRVSVSGIPWRELPWGTMFLGTGAIALGGTGAWFKVKGRPLPWGLGRRLRGWPRLTAQLLGIVPLVLLAFLGLSVVWNGMGAVGAVGLDELLSANYRSIYGGSSQVTARDATGDVFGTLPALLGTLMQVTLAMCIALPVAMALAVAASEGASGPITDVIRLTLGVFAGIPPIVYAIGAIVFVQVIMVPKFAGGMEYATFDAWRVGANPASWPPDGLPWSAGALPWDQTGRNNSSILGGLLLALLVIPFMAPLIDDALRNVPKEMKEGSLALGVGRWETLRRVTLPMAAHGIIGAATLGTLKAMGDLMIAVFVIGWGPNLPSPLLDVMERVPPLTAFGAGLMGGFSYGAPGDKAVLVGYFSAFQLLILAGGVLLLSSLLRRQFAHGLRR